MPNNFPYEIRDPIHGFVGFTKWERDIINHPVFQRLRRIRQLGLTDMVYPGAMHTRFEHSLGVMHIATQMFEEIAERRKEYLKKELHYEVTSRDKRIVRLASLLHDVGHSPFSHAGEGLMCPNPNSHQEPEKQKNYKHEDYSAAAVEFLMKDVIDDHPHNHDAIKAKDIADFLRGAPKIGIMHFLWKELVSGQLDADRADYLIRDSRHIGVAYGTFDLDRILKTLTVIIDPETDSPRLAVEDGGIHAAEALIIARYMMFTQVYFQHTRRAYDHHITEVMKNLLAKHQEKSDLERKDAFPPPTSGEMIKDYLKWDDWRVLGEIWNHSAGEDGEIIATRNHHRSVYETGEHPSARKLIELESICEDLGDGVAFVDKAEKSWYKFDFQEQVSILQRPNMRDEEHKQLSDLSSVVNGLKGVNQNRVYTSREDKKWAINRVAEFTQCSEQ